MHVALGTNRVLLGHRPKGAVGADGGSEEEHIADVQEEEAPGEVRDIMKTKTDIATTTMTVTETETDEGAMAKNY